MAEQVGSFFRNAVFMDLVERPWPVQSGGNALVYYLGFWLPSALVAKLTHSLETGFFIQNASGMLQMLLLLIYNPQNEAFAKNQTKRFRT